MDCQQVEANSNITIAQNIHVMVVDDDTTSLRLVSNLLKTFNYRVALFNDPTRALYSLQAGKRSFNLIMTALYMSKMDGFELTRRVNNEFKLPVIMISNDDRESVMLKAMEEGVALYLLKPFSPNDLKNIWQFVITTKSISTIPSPNLMVSHGVEFRAVETQSISSSSPKIVPEIKKKKKDSKAKANDIASAKIKKPKVVWTDFLQYRFLNAVHYIGLERAVPKKILEVMNVPFLTRENVASHLQKYRIFLKKVAERCMITSDKTTEEIVWSKFLSRHASLVLEKIQQKRAFTFNSSQYFSNPTPNPSNHDHYRFTHGQLSFAKNLSPYAAQHTASYVNGSIGTLPLNQNNAQGFNLSPNGQHSYLGSSSLNNNNYNPEFSVGVGGDISGAHKGIVSNGIDGNCGGLDGGVGMGNFQNGVGVGGDNNSYNNWGLICNNGVNFGGNSHTTMENSSIVLNNEVGGQDDCGLLDPSLNSSENFAQNPIPNQQSGRMEEQSLPAPHNNMYADEECPDDLFSIDEKVLNELFASLVEIEYSAKG